MVKGDLHKHHCLAEPSKLPKQAHLVTGAGQEKENILKMEIQHVHKHSKLYLFPEAGSVWLGLGVGVGAGFRVSYALNMLLLLHIIGFYIVLQYTELQIVFNTIYT